MHFDRSDMAQRTIEHQLKSVSSHGITCKRGYTEENLAPKTVRSNTLFHVSLCVENYAT